MFCKGAADGNIAHLDKVSTLYHEAFDDSMKGTALVTNWLHVAPVSSGLGEYTINRVDDTATRHTCTLQ